MRQETKTKLTIKNQREETITFASDGHEQKLIDFDTGAADSDMQTIKAPYEDGEIFIDSHLEKLEISLEFILRHTDQRKLEKLKRQAARVMNPRLGKCELRYTRVDGTYVIDAVADGVPEFQTGSDNRLPGFQRGQVDFVAPLPYWRSRNQTTRALKAYEGKFTLPFKLPFELGRQGDRTAIFNDGDVSTPVKIDLEGPVTNPQIRNETTNEFIKVKGAIAEDEILHIDTTPNKKRIEIYRDGDIKNAFGRLAFDEGATFWQLETGSNDVSYIADKGNNKAIVTVSYHERYAGI